MSTFLPLPRVEFDSGPCLPSELKAMYLDAVATRSPGTSGRYIPREVQAMANDRIRLINMTSLWAPGRVVHNVYPKRDI